MKRRSRSNGPPQDDWITTYADAITLLMAFFVMMFSMSELKQDKFAEFQSAIDAALGNKKAEGLPTPKHAQQKTEKKEVFSGMADNAEDRVATMQTASALRQPLPPCNSDFLCNTGVEQSGSSSGS